MADGIKAKIAGVWKDLTPSIKVGGVWKTPDAVHIKVGGVWKQVWSGETVTVSGETINGFNFGATANAGAYFYQSGSSFPGQVRKRENNTYTLIDTATDWLRPTTATTSNYRIAHDGGLGDTGAYNGNITTTYSAINAIKYLNISDDTPSFGGNSATYVVYIDAGSNPPIEDSGTYVLTADREDF